MNIAFTPSAYRRAAASAWLLYMAWVAFYWLGLTGIGLVCVLSTRWVLTWPSPAAQRFAFEADQVDGVWVMPFAVAVRIGHERRWLFRDETGPAQWAGILRGLRQLPLRQPQAVGLNISR